MLVENKPLTFFNWSSELFWPFSGLSAHSRELFSSEPDFDSELMKTILNLLLSGTIFFSSITMSLLLSDSMTV